MIATAEQYDHPLLHPSGVCKLLETSLRMKIVSVIVRDEIQKEDALG